MARKPIERAPVVTPVDVPVAQPVTTALAPVAPPTPLVFTNTTANTTIHLGDGRKLAPGESAKVSAELLRILESGE